MKEHLAPEELLASLQFCTGWYDSDREFGCKGCPNAVPGTEDKDGFCECRFDTTDEMIHLLETLVKNNK